MGPANHYNPQKINILEYYSPTLNSITPIPSQSILVQHSGTEFIVHLDSGATVSFVTLRLAQSLNINIKPNGQLALLADEKTRMQSLGEVNILVLTGGRIVLRLRALVVKQLQVACYAGTTFHVDNDVTANITNGTISIHGGKFNIVQHNKLLPGAPTAHPPPALTVQELAEQENVQATLTYLGS